MIDSAEKVRVITALKNCLDRPRCRDCPWHECEEVFDDDCAIPRNLAEKALALVEELMTVEPKRGRWLRYKSGNSSCSECGEEWFAEYKPNYCPNCGAKMEGSKTDG